MKLYIIATEKNNYLLIKFNMYFLVNGVGIGRIIREF